MLPHTLLLASFFIVIGSKCEILVSATEEPFQGCVNHPPSSCPVPDEKTVCRCKRVEGDSTVVCCNIENDFLLTEGLRCVFGNSSTGNPSLVTALHILNCTIEKLDATKIAEQFKNLIGISVTGGHIARISGLFPTFLTCLNLSSNHLMEIDPPVLSNLVQLGCLDLSNNNLTHLPNLTFRNSKAYFFLDVSGNFGIKCIDVHKEMKQHRNSSTQLIFVNENDTYCSTQLNYQWFNSINIVPFHQIELLEQIESVCPKDVDYECHCTIGRNVEMLHHFYYMVKVDCSGQGLTELPKEIPPNTYFLNVSNNNITSLNYLASNPSYGSLLHVIADNNRIESITELEGTRFIDNFFLLSLRNNRIKLIPKYVLTNAFDRNLVQREVYLGMNGIPCDCSTAQVLKVWLLHYSERIIDYKELYCDNLNYMRVIDLDQSKVCIYLQEDWTDYIYYIIALEILLFVLLFVKVFYDYWVFKTTGSLPWPASNMPRLPCDWFFEL